MSSTRLLIIAIYVLAICGNPSKGRAAEPEAIQADLLIVGATESGWAAAIQAARMGVESVVIVHDGRWIGGQFTEQALVCVDENKGVGTVGWGVDWHPMKRSFHRSGLFRELMDRIEAFNTRKYGSPMPGRPFHGPSTFRPAEAEAIFREMLQPWIDSGRVRLIVDRYPVSAVVTKNGNRPRLTGLTFAPVDGAAPDLQVSAKVTVDASDWGEAIQAAGAEFECGPDPRDRHHEPSAPPDLSDNPPNEMNPITWPMIVEQADSDETIERPARFDDRLFVRSTGISRQAMNDLPWDRPVRLGSIPHWPDKGRESPRQLTLLTVRRIVDGTHSKDGKTSVLLNYTNGQDYPLERLPDHVAAALEATEPGASEKNIVLLNRNQRQIIFDDARRHSLCLLYHLQNFVHDRASDTANSFRHYRLSDEFGTPDRLPPKPYIRESLRLKAMYMMKEQDGRNADGITKDMARERFAQVMYPDGIFCWQFHYDFHNTGRAYLKDSGDGRPFGPAGPWIDFEKPGRHTRYVSDRSVFPLRSLIPQTMDGLLGAEKNLGYSSIVCAAIRLHDQGIAVGQAAGAAAAVAISSQAELRLIPMRRSLLEQVRDGLCRNVDGEVPLLLWPYRDLNPDHPAFVAICRLAACGAIPIAVREVDFQPDAVAVDTWKAQVISLTKEQFQADEFPELPTGQLTRGEFCRQWWNSIRHLPLREWSRQRPLDADADGIPDPDDPTPFAAHPVVEWSIEPPGPNEDGLPNPGVLNAAAQAIDFTTVDRESRHTANPWKPDVGRPFDEQRGYGWQKDISTNNRRRNLLKEPFRDTFVFTRTHDQWDYRIENGTYRVTACVGDAGHDQPGQYLQIEGVGFVNGEGTLAGRFLEMTRTVSVSDGLLTVRTGQPEPGHNTCLNWLVVNPE
ncbi:MAG: FAD-dependent oxidoreductase [Planctomycetaceae bacterium]